MCWPSWCFGVCTIVCLIIMVNSNVDLDSALRVAHCRASCIHKINRPMFHPTSQRCRTSIDCSQCWDVCSGLGGSATVCSNQHCVGGCMEACSLVSAGFPPPVLLTRSVEELSFSPSTVSWPPAPPSGPPTVYVVMVDHQQYLQTLDLTAPLPPSVDPLTVQVLVVDWRGFTGVFTPRPPSPLEHARDLVRHLGLQDTILFNDKRSNSSRSQRPWGLREVSRTFQPEGDVARITISWEPWQAANHSQHTYLVTWLLEGGLLRGNLLTNMSTATLSLQADTIYRIQVALFTMNLSDWASDPMEVDTHRDSGELSVSNLPSRDRPTLLTPAGDPHPQLVACLAAAVTAWLVVVLVLTWRWRYRMALPHSKLVEEDIGVTNLYRVFPPAIRLIEDDVNVRVNVFSSRDNLLQN